MYNKNVMRAFTLIEILITLGIMVMLTSILIVYSRRSEQQIALFKEQAKVVSIILRAKSLAIQTSAGDYQTGDPILCGYGVHFEYDPGTKNNRYFIFKDLVDPGANCSKVSDKKYSTDFLFLDDAKDVKVEEFALPENLQFAETSSLTDVLFMPPEPKVWREPTGPGEKKVTIVRRADPTAKGVSIIVGYGGDVTAK